MSRKGIAYRLRVERLRKGLSQSDVAYRSGLKPSAISHFETAKRMPSALNLSKLADALQTTADYLLGRIPLEEMDKKSLGLFKKFNVTRTDGTSEPGKKHHRCEYFVLDITHDTYAVKALHAYADACNAEFPVLAIDLWKKCREPRL